MEKKGLEIQYIILNNSSLIASACMTMKMMELFSFVNVQGFQATQCLHWLKKIFLFFFLDVQISPSSVTCSQLSTGGRVAIPFINYAPN
jgi:hypothetical protein